MSPYLIAEMRVCDAGSSSWWMAAGPIGVGDEIQELCERWYTLCLAPLREHVVCQREFIVFPAVVLPDESFDLMPRALDRVGV
jgi:hypothetical protein